MIYLDNASTTNKKPLSVKLAILKAFCKKYCANPGRSSHKYSVNAEQVVYETRDRAKNFFNNDNTQNVVFTSGCTEALNTAIFGTLKKGGHIVYTTNEHNSVARPLEQLCKENFITTTLVKTDTDGTTNPKKIEEAITNKTYLVIVNHTSNVTGATSDIKTIGKICKKHNCLLLVDGAQSAGHQKIDMINDNISILAVAGHKGLLAGQGIGILLFRDGINIKPTKFGGTGTYSEQLLPPVSYPESLEAGTGATPLIFGLNAGLKYLEKNFDKVNDKIHNLTKLTLDELSKLPQIELFTQKNCYNGVISFRVKNIPSSDVVEYMNNNGICIRSGLHCAPLCHKKQGTLDGGTVRVSISNFNKKWELKKFINKLKQFIAQI